MKKWTNNPAHPDLYYNQTAHHAANEGSMVTLRFNGTEVHYVGVRNTDHGSLSCTLDGGQTTTVNGKGTFEAHSNLCSFSALDNETEHSLVVKNEGGGSMDIDYFLVTFDDRTEVLQQSLTDDQIRNQGFKRTVSVDDRDPSIVYEGVWEAKDHLSFFNHSTHTANTTGARATITFQGASAISFLGSTKADHGLGTCEIEGGPRSTFNGSAATQGYTRVFCGFDGLDPTQEHVLHVVNLEDKFLDVDLFLLRFFVYPCAFELKNSRLTIDYYPPSTGGKNEESGSADGSEASSSNSGSPVGVIGGLAVIVLSIFLYRRHKSSHKRIWSHQEDSTAVLGTIEKPFTPSPFTPPPSSQTGTGSIISFGGMEKYYAGGMGVYGYNADSGTNDVRNAHQLRSSPPGSSRLSGLSVPGGGIEQRRRSESGYGGDPIPSQFPEIQDWHGNMGRSR
ncbi:hypothetical protein BT69DRAFT_1316740 [Atractiella rhizophila]|nr:hypothetical protein BT69DRAFT_1316740 [Atractiella rhizophila]